MALYRTGIKKYALLVEYDLVTGLPTGNTKPNLPSDPDYVAPETDVAACPVGIIPTPTTTTTTVAPTTTTTTVVLPDPLRIHVGYVYQFIPGVSYTDFDVDIEIKTGANLYYDGHVFYAQYQSGNTVVSNSNVRGPVDITVNNIVAQANWMKILYSTNGSYPNPGLGVGVVLYEGAIDNFTGLSVPSSYNGTTDILVIQFETVEG
jgi:hypothetical protein